MLDNQESGRFIFNAGRFIRHAVISHIKNAAFMNGLTIDIQEDRGILYSTFRVQLSGKGASQATKSLYDELGQLWKQKKP